MEEPQAADKDDFKRLERMVTMLHSNMVGMQAWLMALAEEMAMLRTQVVNVEGQEAMDRIRRRVEQHIDQLAELHEEDLENL
jgi:hypothetical protein